MPKYMPSAAKIERKWYVVDATDMTLGRLASEVAKVLRGKNKPIFTPFLDTGDYVIILNAGKIKVTGKKLDQKIYFRHSDIPSTSAARSTQHFVRCSRRSPSGLLRRLSAECFLREDLASRCTRSFTFTKAPSTITQLRSLKSLRSNRRLKGDKNG